DEFCEALGQLHDTVDAQWSEGVRPEAVQARLNGEGLALRQLDEVSASSGSIAEVFFGELEDGTEVAVKCLRPGIRTLLEGDLRWLLMASRWADHHLPRSGIGKAAEDFAEQVWMQMDFDIESSHLSRFRSNFARSGESIAFPAPLFTAPDLLVLTRERGHNVAHLFRQADEVRKQAASSAAAAQPADGSQASTGKVERQTVRPEHLRQVLGMSDEACQAVAHAGMGCFMRMLFMDCFIHGDMHPGNLILRLKDESEGFVRSPLQRAADWLARLAGRSPWQPFELVVLDAGLAIPMARQKVDALRSLALSIMYQDYSRAADILYSESPDSSQCQDPSAFKMEIAEIFRGQASAVPADRGRRPEGAAGRAQAPGWHRHHPDLGVVVHAQRGGCVSPVLQRGRRHVRGGAVHRDAAQHLAGALARPLLGHGQGDADAARDGGFRPGLLGAPEPRERGVCSLERQLWSYEAGCRGLNSAMPAPLPRQRFTSCACV
ncbi:unnamed protein product, partial [Prorocentrum cordatum]